MSDGGDGRSADTTGQNEHTKPSWSGLNLADLDGLDIEQPIAGSTSVNCRELSGIYRAASSGKRAPPAASVRRCFAFVADALGMHFKPEERYEPFGAMVALADGSRSAIPSDLASYIDVLASIAERASNPALKARMADLCWLLDRKRGALGWTAMAAYADVVKSVGRGDLTYGRAGNDGVLERDTCEHLRRALFIGLALGRNKAGDAAVRQLVSDLREQAAQQGHVQALLWLSELDIQFGISDGAADLAVAMEIAIAALPPDEDVNSVVNFWRFAASAYHQANRNDDFHRCRREAAEILVLQADALRSSSSMRAAHFLSSAIAPIERFGSPQGQEAGTPAPSGRSPSGRPRRDVGVLPPAEFSRDG